MEDLDEVEKGPLPQYTFEEFSEHADKVQALLKEDRTAENQGFYRSLAISSDYFKTIYTDNQERFFKHSRFCVIMNYLSHHLPDFDKADYAVYGSPKVGGLISEHLLRAIHHVYTTDLVNEDPSPAEFMKLAEQFREAEEHPVETA